MTDLLADNTEFRKDVNQLMSTDMSLIFVTMEITDVPSIKDPTYSNVPPTTIGVEVRPDEVVVTSNTEKDEKHISVPEGVVYEDQADLEGVILEITRHTSLNSMVCSNGSKDDETPDANAYTMGVMDM